MNWYVKRGELWWAFVGERCPVVLLSTEDGPDIRAMRIVAAATAEEKRGFIVLSGEEALDPARIQQTIASIGADVRGIGVEVEIGTDEGLPRDGVVRVAIASDGRIFCT